MRRRREREDGGWSGRQRERATLQQRALLAERPLQVRWWQVLQNVILQDLREGRLPRRADQKVGDGARQRRDGRIARRKQSVVVVSLSRIERRHDAGCRGEKPCKGAVGVTGVDGGRDGAPYRATGVAVVRWGAVAHWRVANDGGRHAVAVASSTSPVARAVVRTPHRGTRQARVPRIAHARPGSPACGHVARASTRAGRVVVARSRWQLLGLWHPTHGGDGVQRCRLKGPVLARRLDRLNAHRDVAEPGGFGARTRRVEVGRTRRGARRWRCGRDRGADQIPSPRD
mmetsp:Transcript_32602/g.85344  ORF Transcript_32602/g.85344 Transcript_32602/m.85344 type:complete len:287 (-) Transcript_32602:530-1390(-)